MKTKTIQARDLLSAEHVGLHELRKKLGRICRKKTMTVVTWNSKPQAVFVPYNIILDIYDELRRISHE